jgi:hypothetical protein
MSAASLKERVDELEREVRQLKLVVEKANGDQRPWWDRLAGAFKDDPAFEKIVRAGRKYRKSLARGRR